MEAKTLFFLILITAVLGCSNITDSITVNKTCEPIIDSFPIDDWNKKGYYNFFWGYETHLGYHWKFSTSDMGMDMVFLNKIISSDSQTYKLSIDWWYTKVNNVKSIFGKPYKETMDSIHTIFSYMEQNCVWKTNGIASCQIIYTGTPFQKHRCFVNVVDTSTAIFYKLNKKHNLVQINPRLYYFDEEATEKK